LQPGAAVFDKAILERSSKHGDRVTVVRATRRSDGILTLANRPRGLETA
jgi:hypothetical protein